MEGENGRNKKNGCIGCLGLIIVIAIIIGIFSSCTSGNNTNASKSVSTKNTGASKPAKKQQETNSTTSTSNEKNKTQASVENQPVEPPVTANGGIGDTLPTIEKKYGKHNRVNTSMKDGIGQYGYQDDLYIVSFEDNRVSNVMVQLDTKNEQMPIKDAIVMAQQMMPRDAVQIGTEDPYPDERLYVFKSASIEKLFPADAFGKDDNGNPQTGIISVDVPHDGNTAESFSIAIGK